MKSVSILLFFQLLLVSSGVYAQEKVSDELKKITYGQKGIIELYNGLALSGNTRDSSSLSFSADPGINYFVTNNFYLGSRLLVNVNKELIIDRYDYIPYKKYYKTNVKLGWVIPFGFVFKIKEFMYFNLTAPEFHFYLNDLKRLSCNPNIITSMKFPFDNAIAELGIKHNFIHFDTAGVSKPYYSYNVFLGLSAYFDTGKKDREALKGGASVQPKNEDTKEVAFDQGSVRGRIAGAFFLSWIPVSSGSWLAGWDWGGLVFSVLKTAGMGCAIATMVNFSHTPVEVGIFGMLAWPVFTLTDMIYSPCRVAFRLNKNQMISAEEYAIIGARIAGSFFLSWLPVCSGSWLAGWDWGGLVFSIFKTTAMGFTLGGIFRPDTIPWGVCLAGIIAWPIMTLIDVIYSPCRVTYRLRNALHDPNAQSNMPRHSMNKQEDNDHDVFFNAMPRLSMKSENVNKNNQATTNYKIDGLNIMVTHIL